jgi:hypothetical protein
MEPKLEQCLGAYIVAGVATGLLIGALTHSDVWAPTGIPRRSPEPPTTGLPGPVARSPSGSASGFPSDQFRRRDFHDGFTVTTEGSCQIENAWQPNEGRIRLRRSTT